MKYIKTNHFVERCIERGISQELVDFILQRIGEYYDGKSSFIISSSILRQFNLNLNMIVVIDNNVLITVFFVPDLYSYLKSQPSSVNYQIID